MQMQYALIEIVLFFGILSNTACSFYLGLHRPVLLMPSIALALLSLVVLSIFAIAKISDVWFYGTIIYSIIYPMFIVLFWWRFRRKNNLDISPITVMDAQQTCPVSLTSEHGHAFLSHRGGVRRSLHHAGQPIDALLPGWSVNNINIGLAPIVIVSMIHLDEHVGRWIIDPSSETYSELVSQLPQSLRDALYTATKRLLHNYRNQEELSIAAWSKIDRVTKLELLANTVNYQETGENALIEIICARRSDMNYPLKVCSDDNFLSALLSNGTEVPILLDGSVLRHTDLLPGWSADGLHCDFAPFFLLELRHETGARATWLLDRNLSRIGDINSLDDATKDELCAYAAPVIERHLASVLAFAEPASDPTVERYLQLNDDVRHVLTVHCAGSIRLPPTPLGLRQVPSMLPSNVTTRKDEPIFLHDDAIEKAVTTDLHQQTIKAIRSHRFEWPSPVDGSSAVLKGIFVWEEHAFFYQFSDRSGVDFIVIAADRSARLIGLVVPSVNLLFFDDRKPNSHEPTEWLRNNFGGGFWWMLIRHINLYAHELASRRRTEHARPVNVLLTSSRLHIGHHLWNDLSGFEALCAVVSSEQLPTTLIIGAPDGSAEFFGPIEALFPATLGHVDRSLKDIDAFVRWIYRNDVWPTRITREYVSGALRQNIMSSLVKDKEEIESPLALCVQPEGDSYLPTIVFGLRVEDRTLVDLPGFCEAFVAFIAERYPGSTIVFDGYNCRPGDTSGSVIPGMVYHLTSQPPEDVEKALVAFLIETFSGKPINIVGTTGQSIATSLAWCQRADAAFAIWGAGLTKIRWLANLPTMAVTSHANMLRRRDLAIYHDPDFMEAPAPMLFPDPSLITDIPEHAALASKFIQGGRECFIVNTAEVLLDFDNLLMSVLQKKRRTATRRQQATP